MKSEHINPFLVGVKNIFQDVAQMSLASNGISVKTSPTASKNVVVMLGLTGDLRGTIAMNLDEELTKKIASNMMGGMPVLELDELSKSAISELCNMIMGTVCTLFAEQQLSVDITPPSLMTGQNIHLSFTQTPVMSVKFGYEEHEIDLDLSIVEK
ncbi:chemotaxis protein CheX [Bacillus sp. BRMEA1]|uniref:chemotaxis protein CheX n=1 Tax=Neobacillus endophyticus TaxID=2738405 RepID=UPI0015661C6C|nr:chemotaxis protein CheX [Neobacillus endophyticus]NRD77292.1 chemotaxis protein CheX [Neobacillus endophyticus]